MSEYLFDYQSRLRPRTLHKGRRGLEPFLGRLALTATVALIPLTVFFVPGSIIGEPGEAGSMLAMLVAMCAASSAMQLALHSRLRFRADRGSSIGKAIVVGGQPVGTVPDCDLATLSLEMFDDPRLALAQAAIIWRAALRIAVAVLIIAPACLVWEVLIFAAMGFGDLPTGTTMASHVTITDADLAAIDAGFRSMLAFNIVLVLMVALGLMISGVRFGLRNKYRERRDAVLREHFQIGGTDPVSIVSAIAFPTPRGSPQ